MKPELSVSWKEVIGATAGAGVAGSLVISAGQYGLGYAFDPAMIVTGSLALAGIVFVFAVLGEIELRGLSSTADWMMLGLAEFVVGFGATLAMLSFRARLTDTGMTAIAGPPLLIEAWWPALVGGLGWAAFRLVMVPQRLRHD